MRLATWLTTNSLMAVAVAGLVAIGLLKPAGGQNPDPAPNCIGEPADHPEVDYPERRVFLESQGWWGERENDGDVPRFGDAEHLHIGACFPLQQTVSGTVRMDFRVVAHNAPEGSMITETRFHDPDNEGIGRVIIDWDHEIDTAPPSNVVLWAEDVEIDTTVYQDGLREARPLTLMERPDGAGIHASGGWCWNIQNTPGTADDPDPRPLCGNGFIQGRGWYDCFEYKLAQTWRWRYPYDGIPAAQNYALDVHLRDGASGTEGVTGHFARLDPRFHMNDQGVVLFDHGGEHDPESLSVPGGALTLGAGDAPREHVLFLMTFENDECTELSDPPGFPDQMVPEDGEVSGGIRIPVRVNPRTSVALEVDPSQLNSNGNGVFEPGERVEVKPTWRNDASTTVVLDGAAADFGGPDGATYTVLDGSASYGVVASGVTASCPSVAGCYQMKLNDPSSRPLRHWDAEFIETLSGGTGKQWALHVGDSYTDVSRANPFYRPIETALHHGIMSGCGGSQFCPTGIVDRADMAEFMVQAKLMPFTYTVDCAAGDEEFDDVPAGHPQCKWIERLSRMGVTSGCGGGDYCPNGSVTRAQMTVFLLRTLEWGGYTPPSCNGIFSDVPCPSTFADWVEEAYARGITAGCSSSPLKFCPNAVVGRSQMASFISNTFALDLYSP